MQGSKELVWVCKRHPFPPSHLLLTTCPFLPCWPPTPRLLPQIGQLISDAMMRVGRAGVVTMEESKTAEDSLHVVEGMQFDRGYISPYFVTDPERMVAEYDNCKLLLVDKKISTARDMIGILEGAIRSGHPLLIMAEDIEQVRRGAGVCGEGRGRGSGAGWGCKHGFCVLAAAGKAAAPPPRSLSRPTS